MDKKNSNLIGFINNMGNNLQLLFHKILIS